MSPKKATQKFAKSTTVTGKKPRGLTDEERAAIKDRIQELKADKADGESAVLVKIATMPESDRVLGERLHAIVKASAPALSPRLWYGMPAYAKDGKVVCFFQSAQKFNTRYATYGCAGHALSIPSIADRRAERVVAMAIFSQLHSTVGTIGEQPTDQPWNGYKLYSGD